jgi:hypothetical protein
MHGTKSHAVLLCAVLQGYNATVLAYGQTGSGKTLTMSGGTGIHGLPENGGQQQPLSDGLSTGSCNSSSDRSSNSGTCRQPAVSAWVSDQLQEQRCTAVAVAQAVLAVQGRWPACSCAVVVLAMGSWCSMHLDSRMVGFDAAVQLSTAYATAYAP